MSEKLKAIVDGKTVDVLEVKEYDNERNLVEIFFMFNGRRTGAIISKNNLLDSIAEIKTEELMCLLKEEGFESHADFFGFDDELCAIVTVTGIDYVVYVQIDEKGEYFLSTLNIEKSKHYSVYEDEYKNKAIRKTTKGALNYVKKFVE